MADPRRPAELATGLGMRRWIGHGPVDGLLLVWFNFRDSLGGDTARPQLAISWKTTNDHQGRYRNAPVAELARLLARHDCDWHVAQHGALTEDLAVLRRSVPAARLHADTLHPAADMATFAGELAALDAVVTVDNSLLHLAGGLGLPTLGLLTIPAYWAWPAEGPGSRWYAAVRLLRQRVPGAWRDVFDELDAALGELPMRRRH